MKRLWPIILIIGAIHAAYANPPHYVGDLTDKGAARAVNDNDRYLYDQIRTKYQFPKGIYLAPMQEPACVRGSLYFDDGLSQMLCCPDGLNFVALSTGPAAGGVGVHGHVGGTGTGGQLSASSIFNAGTLGVIYGGSGANLSATGGSQQYVKQTSAGATFTVGTIPAVDVQAGSLGSGVIASSLAVNSVHPAAVSAGTYSNVTGVGTLGSLRSEEHTSEL